MAEVIEQPIKSKGLILGIIACVLALISMFQWLVMPLAVLFAIFGTFISIKDSHRPQAGVLVNIVAWILLGVAVFVSGVWVFWVD